MADGSEQHATSSVLIQALMEGDISLVDITINLGFGSRKISWGDLEEDFFRLQEIKDSKATCPTIKLLEPLSKAGNRLNYLRQKAFGFVLQSRPYKFVKELSLPDYQAAVDEILVEQAEALTHIRQGWSAEQKSYENRLRQALPDFVAESRIQQYLEKFPSPAEIESGFSVVLFGPIPIRNLREHIHLSAQTLENQEALRVQQAKADLNRKAMRGIESCLEKALLGTQTELQEIILAQLDRIQKSKTETLSTQAIAAMQDAIARAKVLASFDGNLSEIAQKLEVVSNSAIAGSGLLEKRLAEFTTLVDGVVDLSKSKVSIDSFMV
ncbi:hypothetical protein ACQ4M4_11290 [Leptolyngbya sp. AN02str]|uniref:hypothetical protein n=1 Tax=Leptolyngbya sp. AN02str TaxID=3423363 RepID=UPI003D312ECE